MKLTLFKWIKSPFTAYQFPVFENDYDLPIEYVNGEVGVYNNSGIYDAFGQVSPIKTTTAKLKFSILKDTRSIDTQAQTIKQVFAGKLGWLYAAQDSGLLLRQYFKPYKVNVQPRENFRKYIADVEIEGTLWPLWTTDPKVVTATDIVNGDSVNVIPIGPASSSQGLKITVTPKVTNMTALQIDWVTKGLTTGWAMNPFSGSVGDQMVFDCETGEAYKAGVPHRKFITTNYNNFFYLPPVGETLGLTFTFTGPTNCDVRIDYVDLYY